MKMRYEEIVAYTGYGKICQYICIDEEFNDEYADGHHWDTVPFPKATKICIETRNGVFEKELPIAGMDDPLIGSPSSLREAFKEKKRFPTSSNWFQIINELNKLVRKSGDHEARYVLGLEVTDNGEALEFIMGRD
jgi:hypothetical protein